MNTTRTARTSGTVICPDGHMYSARSHGNVCPYCSKTVALSSKPIIEDDPDAAYLDGLEVMDPVTGWLVCIDGPSKGRDYRIRSEKNFVGRSDGMDIQILGDNNISRKNHAVIVYDPKAKKTLLLPGDSHGLVYYEGEAIFGPVELKSHDTIELGKSKFLFVPLCGDHFGWLDLDDVPEKTQAD